MTFLPAYFPSRAQSWPATVSSLFASLFLCRRASLSHARNYPVRPPFFFLLVFFISCCPLIDAPFLFVRFLSLYITSFFALEVYIGAPGEHRVHIGEEVTPTRTGENFGERGNEA